MQDGSKCGHRGKSSVSGIKENVPINSQLGGVAERLKAPVLKTGGGVSRPWHEAEVYRQKGELLLAQDSSNVTPAERCFRTAIEVARKQHAKLWELRATTSLARLLRDTNRRDEARAMLSEIYNWLTESFDTADLKDAKALLEELDY